MGVEVGLLDGYEVPTFLDKAPEPQLLEQAPVVESVIKPMPSARVQEMVLGLNQTYPEEISPTITDDATIRIGGNFQESNVHLNLLDQMKNKFQIDKLPELLSLGTPDFISSWLRLKSRDIKPPLSSKRMARNPQAANEAYIQTNSSETTPYLVAMDSRDIYKVNAGPRVIVKDIAKTSPQFSAENWVGQLYETITQNTGRTIVGMSTTSEMPTVSVVKNETIQTPYGEVQSKRLKLYLFYGDEANTVGNAVDINDQLEAMKAQIGEDPLGIKVQVAPDKRTLIVDSPLNDFQKHYDQGVKVYNSMLTLPLKGEVGALQIGSQDENYLGDEENIFQLLVDASLLQQAINQHAITPSIEYNPNIQRETKPPAWQKAEKYLRRTLGDTLYSVIKNRWLQPKS
jgi:hypothetical protein